MCPDDQRCHSTFNATKIEPSGSTHPGQIYGLLVPTICQSAVLATMTKEHPALRIITLAISTLKEVQREQDTAQEGGDGQLGVVVPASRML